MFFQMSFFYGSDCGALALIGTKTKFLRERSRPSLFREKCLRTNFYYEKSCMAIAFGCL
ncbi:hypothetical protein LEP1GSC043_2571 [Leptospira weilii str. Ecochallenge]|uniref:Uncharacterized protein n=1 Tax=Leptospira weilii str. Ecochallenge TaxID=1049986 RepID=N1TYL5_9LEPT|nr:hypothetical protein LEP1GSC043_2571 [Leptospira weilii str. Ecochallenge]